MDRYGLLNSESSGDEAVLETDIMRFMAIIGIVFWIIFSIVKTMPLTVKTTGPSAAVAPQRLNVQPVIKPELKPAPVPEPQPEKAPPERTPKVVPPVVVPEKMTAQAPKPAPSPEPEPAPPAKAAPQQAQKPVHGLRLEFESLNAIMALVRDKRIDIYCRTSATGFDLFFKGNITAGGITFKNSDTIPKELWEIRDGEAYAYFLDLIAKTYPSIRSFPQKQVLISFLDKDLEKTVDTRLNQLQTENKNGILSVTKDGEIIFKESPEAGENG